MPGVLSTPFHVTCCSCSKEFPEKQTVQVSGDREQYRCKPCNCVKSRVHRLCHTDEVLRIGCKDLDDDERKKMLAEAGISEK